MDWKQFGILENTQACGVPIKTMNYSKYTTRESWHIGTRSRHFIYLLDLTWMLAQGEESITRLEENGELVMVMERRKLEDGREGQLVLRVSNTCIVYWRYLVRLSTISRPIFTRMASTGSIRKRKCLPRQCRVFEDHMQWSFEDWCEIKFWILVK